VIIDLGNDIETEIDDADWDLIKPYEWRAIWNGNHWYAVTSEKDTVTGKTHHIYMHRLIMGEPVGKLVDHIDDDGLQNRRYNLRVANRSQNSQNTRPQQGTATGYKGVWVVKQKDRVRYGARINYSGHRINLGVFDTPEQAARAYDLKAKELFGVYAQPNFKE